MMEMRNFVQLIGHLGADPIVKDTKVGKMARFSVATTEYYRDNGKLSSRTEWHNVVAWNGIAEKVIQKCAKGSYVTLTGKLTNRSYEDANKIKRYITEVLVTEIICQNKDKSDDESTNN
ncbi:MAG: single-stranded DNA-binding protein [Bacteroidales bacterium]|nr:single-stranded DNA-binding protein [Bacteroidales bacterium]